MSSAADAGPSRLPEALAVLERQGAHARPIAGAALFVAVLSLIAAMWLLERNIRQSRELEGAKKQLEEALDREQSYVRKLGQLNTVLTSSKALPEERQAAAVASRKLVQVLPAASEGGFASPAAVPLDQAQLLTVGAPTGWDVDVFWCSGGGAEKSYALARAASESLAEAAVKERAIAPGVRVGRVRLLPIRAQDTSVWRGATRQKNILVVWDSGRGEEQAAAAVLNILPNRETAAAIDQSTLGDNQASSKWYLSVVACSNG